MITLNAYFVMKSIVSKISFPDASVNIIFELPQLSDRIVILEKQSAEQQMQELFAFTFETIL